MTTSCEIYFKEKLFNSPIYHLQMSKIKLPEKPTVFHPTKTKNYVCGHLIIIRYVGVQGIKFLMLLNQKGLKFSWH